MSGGRFQMPQPLMPQGVEHDRGKLQTFFYAEDATTSDAARR